MELSSRLRTAVLSLVGVFSIVQVYRVAKSLSAYAPYYDEAANIIAVQNVERHGIPYFAPDPESPNYSEGAKKFAYWAYAPELYLRAPIYELFQIKGFDARIWSGLAYFLALVAGLVCWARRDREFEIFALVTLSLILFGHGGYLASTFHYVRYYSFSVMSLYLAHILTVWLVQGLRQRPVRNAILILVVSFLPTMFHFLNFLYLLFWLSVLMVLGFVAFKSIWEKKRGLRFTKATVAVLVILGGIFFLAAQQSVSWSYLRLNFEPGETWRSYLIHCLRPGSSWALVIMFLVSLRQRKYHGLAARVFLLALAFQLFSLVAIAVFGQRVLLVPQRYFLFLGPFVLLASASFGVLCVEWGLSALRRQSYLNTLVALLGLCAAFWVLPVTIFKPFDFMPQALLDEVARYASEPDTIIFSQDSQIDSLHFPQRRSFTLRAAPVLSGDTTVDGLFYRDADGYVRDTYYSVYAGRLEDFCRVLNSYRARKLVFWNVHPELLEPRLAARFSEGLELGLTPKSFSSREIYKQVCAAK